MINTDCSTKISFLIHTIGTMNEHRPVQSPLPTSPLHCGLDLPRPRRPRIPSRDAEIRVPAQLRPPRELASAVHDRGVAGRQLIERRRPPTNKHSLADLAVRGLPAPQPPDRGETPDEVQVGTEDDDRPDGERPIWVLAQKQREVDGRVRSERDEQRHEGRVQERQGQQFEAGAPEVCEEQEQSRGLQPNQERYAHSHNKSLPNKNRTAMLVLNKNSSTDSSFWAEECMQDEWSWRNAREKRFGRIKEFDAFDAIIWRREHDFAFSCIVLSYGLNRKSNRTDFSTETCRKTSRKSLRSGPKKVSWSNKETEKWH